MNFDNSWLHLDDHLALSSDQDFYLPDNLIHNQIPVNLMTFPLAPAILCLVLISECSMQTCETDFEHGKHHHVGIVLAITSKLCWACKYSPTELLACLWTRSLFPF